jgi:hypothetical protein
MNTVNGITTPFTDAIVPVPDTSGNNTKTGGVDVRDGMKQTGGEVTIVHGVNVRDDTTDAMTAAKAIKGS